MVFSSILFLFLFLPSVLLIYYVTPLARRNIILFLASLFFYAWGAPQFVIVFLVNILIDYYLAIIIDRTKENKPRINKSVLILSISINLLVLGYFKYANFFIEEFNLLLNAIGMQQIEWSIILLPIGISFFIFHKISYIVDIYRGTEKPFYNIIDYGLYLMLFPQLIAGPIVRFHEISFQLVNRDHSVNKFIEGIWRFSIGLSKKVLIANSLGGVVDQVFSLDVNNITPFMSWIGIILYTFQIYFDFSGYSDMAIGLGKMFGFNLPENFNRPYISRSITEFWHRWHMSLSRFFKDYLYIPLGGNRKSIFRTYINLWTVFLLCGFWHGSNWTFIAWGIYHGFLLVLDKVYLLKRLEKIPSIASNFISFILIVIGWVFFRSESITYAFSYLKVMFSFWDLSIISTGQLNINNKVIFFSIIAGIISFVRVDVFKFKYPKLAEPYIINGIVAITLLFYSSVVLSTGSFNPFIYFRF